MYTCHLKIYITRYSTNINLRRYRVHSQLMVFWGLWWNSRAKKVVRWIFGNQTYGLLTLISWVFMILERFYGKNIRWIDKTWDIQQLLIQPAGCISFTLLYSNHCLLYFDNQFMLTVYYVRLQWIWTSTKCIMYYDS